MPALSSSTKLSIYFLNQQATETPSPFPSLLPLWVPARCLLLLHAFLCVPGVCFLKQGMDCCVCNLSGSLLPRAISSASSGRFRVRLSPLGLAGTRGWTLGL